MRRDLCSVFGVALIVLSCAEERQFSSGTPEKRSEVDRVGLNAEPVKVVAIALEPASITGKVGENRSIVATVRYADERTDDVTDLPGVSLPNTMLIL